VRRNDAAHALNSELWPDNLTEHLQDFLGDMRRRGKPDKYQANLEFRVGRLIIDCGWITAKEVAADSFQAWLRGQTELKDRTANDYLEAARCFFNWLVKLGRVGCNLLLTVEKAKTKQGNAEEVRAFRGDEMLRLLAVSSERKLSAIADCESPHGGEMGMVVCKGISPRNILPA